MAVHDKRLGIFAACVIAVVAIIALVNLYQASNALPPTQAITYSQFLESLDHGQVRSVVMIGQDIVGTFTDKTRFRTYAANDPDLIKALRAKSVAITVVPAPDSGPSWLNILTTLLPIILIAAVAVFFMRRMYGGGGRVFGLGKSKARMLRPARDRVTFADVAGVDEAKESLQEIVDFLRNPRTFQRLGGRIPRGVLLVGPPGSGKTLLARAIAGEASVAFFTISGSDFVEMFVGVGASRVRDLFEQGKKNAPCIIFMDEIDAVGRHRGAGLGQGNDEREQTLNALLVEMDGFASNEGVILIAATNRPDVLDPALVRPGRFDREIVVGNPDIIGREEILKVHVRNVPLASSVDLKAVARGTPGFSGADLMNLVNEAVLLAARRKRDTVGAREFEDAKDKVTMGQERRSQIMSEEEKRLTAYREGGRAIVALHVPAADPVHKATIIPRGRNIGMVKQLPENDQISVTLEQMTSQLAILLAGRAAEEMVFGRQKVTSGAAADIEKATKLARTMVARWGLSEELGMVAYDENREEVFLGHSVTRQHNMSEAIAQTIALEMRKLIDAAFGDAQRILTAHRDQLETVAKGLLQYESLSGEDIKNLLAGKAPLRDTVEHPGPQAPGTEVPAAAGKADAIITMVSPKSEMAPALES
jgi:cell division protease FtsH